MYLVTKKSILTPCPAYTYFCSHSLDSAAFNQQHGDVEVYKITGTYLSTLCVQVSMTTKMGIHLAITF